MVTVHPRKEKNEARSPAWRCDHGTCHCARRGLFRSVGGGQWPFLVISSVLVVPDFIDYHTVSPIVVGYIRFIQVLSSVELRSNNTTYTNSIHRGALKNTAPSYTIQRIDFCTCYERRGPLFTQSWRKGIPPFRPRPKGEVKNADQKRREGKMEDAPSADGTSATGGRVKRKKRARRVETDDEEEAETNSKRMQQ